MWDPWQKTTQVSFILMLKHSKHFNNKQLEISGTNMKTHNTQYRIYQNRTGQKRTKKNNKTQPLDNTTNPGRAHASPRKIAQRGKKQKNRRK